MSDFWLASVPASYSLEVQHNEGSCLVVFLLFTPFPQERQSQNKLNHSIQALSCRARLERESKVNLMLTIRYCCQKKEAGKKTMPGLFWFAYRKGKINQSYMEGPKSHSLSLHFRLVWQDKNENRRHDHTMKLPKQYPKARETQLFQVLLLNGPHLQSFPRTQATQYVISDQSF